MACAQWHSGFPSLLLLELCSIIFLKYRVSTFSDRTKALYFIKNGKVGIFAKVFNVPCFPGFGSDGLNIWTTQRRLPTAQTSAKLAEWRFEGRLSIVIHHVFCTCWHSTAHIWIGPWQVCPTNISSIVSDGSGEIQLDAYPLWTIVMHPAAAEDLDLDKVYHSWLLWLFFFFFAKIQNQETTNLWCLTDLCRACHQFFGRSLKTFFEGRSWAQNEESLFALSWRFQAEKSEI